MGLFALPGRQSAGGEWRHDSTKRAGRVGQCSSAGGHPKRRDTSQRNLPLQIIEVYASKKVIDLAVPDAYQAVKDGIKKGIDKISNRPETQPPPSSAQAE